MLKLLKYEIRKTLFPKIILFGIAVLLEIYYYVMLGKNNTDALLLPIVLLTVLATVGIILMGLQSLMTLHRDMNTKQGYMLFMTPHSRYSILGAKVLENGISTFLAGAFFLALGFADIYSLLAQNDEISEMWDFLQQIAKMVSIPLDGINPLNIIAAVFYFLSDWLATVMLAYFADVLATSLLSGKRGGLLICILIFFVLEILVSNLSSILPSFSDFAANSWRNGIFAILISGVTYYFTAYLMEKHLSV